MLPNCAHRPRPGIDVVIQLGQYGVDADRLSPVAPQLPVLRLLSEHIRSGIELPKTGVRHGVQDRDLDVRHGDRGVGVVPRLPARDAQQRASGAAPRPHSHGQPRHGAEVPGLRPRANLGTRSRRLARHDGSGGCAVGAFQTVFGSF